MIEGFRIEPLGHKVCDFCADPNPVRFFVADDFTFQKDSALPQISEGAWSACKVCGELIDKENWNGLTERSLAVLRRQVPSRYDQLGLRAVVQELHANFRKHRRRDA